MVNKVRIGGIDYSVQSKEYVIDDNVAMRGRITYSPALIELDAKMAIDVIYETLLHEVFHGISTQQNLDLSENIVESLGQNMYAFLKNNPKLLSDILDIAKKDLQDRNEEISLGENTVGV
jgi:hypothetical protein